MALPNFHPSPDPSFNRGGGKRLLEILQSAFALLTISDTFPDAHINNYLILEQLMRMTELAMQGRNYMGGWEEEKAIAHLGRIHEELSTGKISQKDLYKRFLEVIDLLCRENVRVALVAEIAYVEHIMKLDPKLYPPFKKMVDQLPAKITEADAKAAQRKLHQLSSSQLNTKDKSLIIKEIENFYF